MIRVMLANDLNLIRTGLKHIFKDTKQIQIVAEASNSEEAIKLSNDANPEVILVNFNIMGIWDLDATLKLIRKFPRSKILIITDCKYDLLISHLIKSGVVGCISMNTSLEELLEAIKIVRTGQRYLSPEIANLLVLASLNKQQKSPFKVLSDRELEVVVMIVRGMEPQEIANRLYLSTKTVNGYRHTIFTKLSIKNDVELTLLAIRHGLLDLERAATEETITS